MADDGRDIGKAGEMINAKDENTKEGSRLKVRITPVVVGGPLLVVISVPASVTRPTCTT